MSKLVWDASGEREYETGVSNGVLYPLNESGKYTPGVAWSGLKTVTESPSGAESTSVYADNMKYLTLLSAEEFGGTIEAYMAPDEFMEMDGLAEIGTGVTIGQQTRKTFGFCYKTLLGNDEKGEEYGYKLHLIYGCKASPSEKAFNTVNDSPEAMSLSWSFKTTPVSVTGHKATALVTIDSTKVNAAKLKSIEDILYGTDSKEPTLPTPDEIAALLAEG